MALEFWQYALLSEIVYRRSSNDYNLELDDLIAIDPVMLGEFNTSSLTNFGLVIGQGLREDVSNEGFVINPENGFTALVTTDGTNFQITFRGTDVAGQFSALDSSTDTFFAGTDGGRPNPSDSAQDEGDLLSNRQLARGQLDILPNDPSLPQHQWQTAKVLVEFVIKELAAGDPSKVSVTGQSLGGGLAELAAATYGLEGTVFGPAPFARQLSIESFYSTIRELDGSTQDCLSPLKLGHY